MICNDCGNKHGKAGFTVSTYQEVECNWCEQKKYCVQEYKFGLEAKTPKDPKE